ncbi:MAG: hypothetical protein WCP12_11730 [bacterium]
MNVYVNELSFHGQFATVVDLIGGLKRLWSTHDLCKRYGTALYCARNSLATRPGAVGLSVRDAVLRHATPEEKRIILTWLDRTGPFWEDEQIHDPNLFYYLVRTSLPTELVTETGLAECTAQCLAGGDGSMASVSPSAFEYTPILMEVERDNDPRVSCQLDNFWQSPALEAHLENVVRLTTWEDVNLHVRAIFSHLLFSEDFFAALMPCPFSRPAANRIIDLLRILDNLSACVQQDSTLSMEGQKSKETFFTGHHPLFTDSSAPEKIDFANKLTFQHPLTKEAVMFPWHGKIRFGLQYRIHFEWPKINPDHPLPVVYVGPKLTKR